MRNDARPIGEKLREIDEHARQERGASDQPAERARETKERKGFVTNRDPGDEETTPSKESTLRRKI